MMNSSGIRPCGDRVLVLPEELEETTTGGIIIPPSEKEKYQHAQMAGTLVAVGPDAWQDRVTTVERLIDGQWKPVERRTTGYSEPFVEVGSRVLFARYNGQIVPGKDGKNYRLLNDEDITAEPEAEVDFSEFRKREPLGAQK